MTSDWGSVSRLSGRRFLRSAVLVACCALPVVVVAGQATESVPDAAGAAGAGVSFELAWYSIDAGGATDTRSGAWSLSGTVGQPDAGAEMSGGDMAVTGGFWALAAAAPAGDCNGDLVVDLGDTALLGACLSGPQSESHPTCACIDLDDDGDVDLADAAVLAAAFGDGIGG